MAFRTQLIARHLPALTAIDPEVLEKARTQPEFKAPVWDYFDNRVHERSVPNGQALAQELKPWLDRIEARFGVSRNILLAIWSMESKYGEILKRPDVVRSVIRSLATLAYADKRRAKFARTQLIAALKILQRGDIIVDGLARFLGWRDGPHAVHPDQLHDLWCRHGWRWPPRHLEFGAGLARLICQSVAQEWLAVRSHLGL